MAYIAPIGCQISGQVTYDPSLVTYEQLLDVFWGHVDPTQKNAQGNDVGSQYRSGIYVHNEEQREAAEASLRRVQEELTKVKEIEVRTSFRNV
jgi:peptide-methionine (S)-S-oxide reductase